MPRILADGASAAAFLWLALSALLSSVQPAAHAEPAAADETVIAATIAGELLYNEPAALPPESEVVIQLVEMARIGVPISIVAERRLPLAGGRIPARYRIDYDAVKISPHGLYEVAARVVHGDRLFFISARATPVITRGSPGLADIRLKKIVAAQ